MFSAKIYFAEVIPVVSGECFLFMAAAFIGIPHFFLSPSTAS
jgi:hypothetical protein